LSSARMTAETEAIEFTQPYESRDEAPLPTRSFERGAGRTTFRCRVWLHAGTTKMLMSSEVHFVRRLAREGRVWHQGVVLLDVALDQALDLLESRSSKGIDRPCPPCQPTPNASTMFRKPRLCAAGLSGCFSRPDVACKPLSTHPVLTLRPARVGLVVAD
jgi:hypothetical protein